MWVGMTHEKGDIRADRAYEVILVCIEHEDGERGLHESGKASN